MTGFPPLFEKFTILYFIFKSLLKRIFLVKSPLKLSPTGKGGKKNMATSSVAIAVRVRPFNQREVRCNSVNIVVMDPLKSGWVALRPVRSGKVVSGDKSKEFQFDFAQWTHDKGSSLLPCSYAGQEEVYVQIGRPVLHNALEGFNSCLFAYGQTGSGKTYSMMGYGDELGIIPRLCKELFQTLGGNQQENTGNQQENTCGTSREQTEGSFFSFSVECSYLEIYNENVHDLLKQVPASHSPALKVRQHPKTGVFIEGLKKIPVPATEDILSLVSQGAKCRTVAATNMNATSSRSHALLFLYITQVRGDSTGETSGRSAKLCLVDLAGSERAAATGAEGDTLMEGASINKSLTVLGMCLSRLADQSETGVKGLPVPYRDSNLTFVLCESIGGNSKTSMLANISPADINHDETISTLRFAQVTKKVKSVAKVNENPVARLIRELKEELAALKGQLSSLGEPPLPSVESHVPLHSNTESLMEKIADSEAALGAVIVAEVQPKNDAPAALPSEGCAEAEVDACLFVDWSQPWLVNLCPHTNSMLLALLPGSNHFAVEDTKIGASDIVREARDSFKGRNCAAFDVNFDPLSNTLRLVSTTVASGVFVNGSQSSSFPHSLAHNDRIVFGAIVMRVSNPSSLPSTPSFSLLYVSVEHVSFVEEFHRKQLECNWLNVLKKRTTELPPLSAENLDDALVVATSECAATENFLVGTFPISSQEVVEYARCAAKFANANLGGTEHESLDFIVPNYGLLLQPEASTEDEFEGSKEQDYENAVEEMLISINDKKRAADLLRQNLLQSQEAPVAPLAEETTIVRECALSEEQLAAAKSSCSDEEAMVQREVTWYEDVKHAAKFRCGGPEASKFVNDADIVTWKKYATCSRDQMPLQADWLNSMTAEANLYEKECSGNVANMRCGALFKMKQSSEKWDARYVMITGKFLAYFYECEVAQRSLGTLWIWGASVRSLSKPMGNMPFVLHVATSTPRRLDEPHANNFYFGFHSSDDRNMWAHWIATAAVPSPPATILQRLGQESSQFLQDKAAVMAMLPSRPQLLLLPPALLWGAESSKEEWVDVGTGDDDQKPQKSVDSSHCASCRAEFTFFRRRYSCQRCQGMFCYNCTNGKKLEPTCKGCCSGNEV